MFVFSFHCFYRWNINRAHLLTYTQARFGRDITIAYDDDDDYSEDDDDDDDDQRWNLTSRDAPPKGWNRPPSDEWDDRWSNKRQEQSDRVWSSGCARGGSVHLRPNYLHFGHFEDAQQTVGGHLDVLVVDLMANGFEDLCTVVLREENVKIVIKRFQCKSTCLSELVFLIIVKQFSSKNY